MFISVFNPLPLLQVTAVKYLSFFLSFSSCSPSCHFLYQFLCWPPGLLSPSLTLCLSLTLSLSLSLSLLSFLSLSLSLSPPATSFISLSPSPSLPPSLSLSFSLSLFLCLCDVVKGREHSDRQLQRL